MPIYKFLFIVAFFLPGYLPAFTLVVDHASVETKKNRLTPTVSMGRIDNITLRFGADSTTGYSRYQVGYETSVISSNASGLTIQTEEMTISMIRTLKIEGGGYRFAGAGAGARKTISTNGTTENYLGLRLSGGGISHLVNRLFARAALAIDIQYPFGGRNMDEPVDMRYGVKARLGVMYVLSDAELAFSYGYRSSIFKLKNGDSFESVSFGPMFTIRVTM